MQNKGRVEHIDYSYEEIHTLPHFCLLPLKSIEGVPEEVMLVTEIEDVGEVTILVGGDLRHETHGVSK